MTAPLTRDHMTRGSRIMVWAYPLFAIAYGAILALYPERELKVSEAFTYADRLMDLTVWGLLYVLVGATQLALRIIKRRAGYVLSLSIFFVAMFVWLVVFAGAVIHTNAVPMAPLWPGFLCIAAAATMISLVAQETGRAR